MFRSVLLAFTLILAHFNAYGQNAVPDRVPGEVIVKLRGKSSSMGAHAFLGRAVAEKGLTLKGSFSRFNVHHLRTKPGQSVDDLINELAQDPSVEYAEPNYYLKRLDVDEDLRQVKYSKSELPSLAPSGYSSAKMTVAKFGRDEALSRMSVPSDSDYTPVVAVIDTGVDVSHEIFVDSGAIWVNPGEIPGNGIDDDQNGYVDDVNGWNFYANTADPYDDDGHGTHVAGIVLGAGMDILSQDAVEPARIRIMPLKFLGANGAGTTSAAIAAIHYAIQNGADILNNSWGGPEYSRALHEAVTYSYQQGVTFVAAAGNSGANNDSRPMFPASLSVPHVMSIAATNDWDELASFSNYGKRSVDLGSPGVAVLSTIPGNGFGYSSGTSMAAPFVAGLAALIKIENPDLNGYEILDLVFGQSKSYDHLDSVISTGSRVDFADTLAIASQVSGGGDLPYYDMNQDSQAQRSVASVEAGPEAGGCGMAAVMSQFRGGPRGPSSRPPFFGFLVALVMIPLVIMRFYQSSSPQSRRRHKRYALNSSVTVNVGGRELVGSIGTISMGGVSLNTEEMLEHGGVVKMSITGPDGQETIDVEGQVVWSEPNKAYGVQFSEAQDSIRQTIRSWTHALTESS